MFYIIEKSVTTEGTAKAINEQSDYDLAVMQLHQVMASAIANPIVKTALCIIMDERGATKKAEYWERPVVEPETEAEP